MLISGLALSKLRITDFIKSLSASGIPELPQIKAWESCFYIIQELLVVNKNLWDAEFLFEYGIPFSNNSRPDILMFVKDHILIIEYKNRENFIEEDIEQVNRYYELLRYYHSEGEKYLLKKIVLLNSEELINEVINDCTIISKKTFINEWENSKVKNLQPLVSGTTFINGRYNPGIDIVNYAKRIFSNEQIITLDSDLLYDTEILFRELSRIIEEARSKQLHTVVCITGEPGSGKSALGFKLKHEFDGAFLTKNPQFIQLLKSHLKYTPDIHNTVAVIKDAVEGKSLIEKNVVIIDEAQRTWGMSKIIEYYGSKTTEQEILLRHIQAGKNWSCTVVLIGIDQQLSRSETSNYGNWLNAFDSLPVIEQKKRAFISPLVDVNNIPFKVVSSQIFHLATNIRAGLNADFSDYINQIIEQPDIIGLKEMSAVFREQNYVIAVTRNLENAVQFVRGKAGNKRMSSCLIGMPCDSIEDGISYERSKSTSVGELNNKMDVSMCFLKERSLSHYHVLGLEFHLPIVYWSLDYLYYNEKWNYDFDVNLLGGHYYIRNAYRVLLSRGRDGMILYFPPQWEFNSTYNFFKQIGFREI